MIVVKTDGNFDILRRLSGEHLVRLKNETGHVLFITSNYSTLEEAEVVIKVIRRTIVKDIHNKNKKELNLN
jgi:hypothetical protein